MGQKVCNSESDYWNDDLYFEPCILYDIKDAHDPWLVYHNVETYINDFVVDKYYDKYLNENYFALHNPQHQNLK